MRDSIRALVWYLSSIYNFPEPILEIGARHTQGQIGYADLRQFFKDKRYIGSDIEPGVGVDLILDIVQLPPLNEQYGTILCLDTIEHISNPLMAIANMVSILKENGILIISSHMWFPVHTEQYEDYWRFTPSCVEKLLLQTFKRKIIMLQGEKNYPFNVVGIALQEKAIDLIINYPYLNSMLPCPYPWPYYEYQIE